MSEPTQPDPTPTPGPQSVLVTGFPTFVARRMTAQIVAADPEARARLLCRDVEAEAARAFVATLPDGHRDRVEVILGAVDHMDLGLSGDDYRELTTDITAVHHMAGISDVGADPSRLRQVRLDGTHNVIELAMACKRLRRLCHWSTAQVAGKRKGVVLEEELDEGQSFHNAFEETQCTAEKLARAAQTRLPVTVLRPGIIVGDSQTGEIDRFDGPYYLMVLIVRNATQVHLPLPGRGTAPLHLVPVDYVVAAAHALCLDERAAGKTFHLVDPNPLPARRVYELVAEHAHTALPRGSIPTAWARTLLRTPGIERLVRAPLAFMDSFDHQVFYNSRNTQSLLTERGIHCPPVDSYVGNLLGYLREASAKRRQATQPLVEETDPFD
ncbi:SDR family oxidoreductase [Haliangium sp.]|uniref:SDR family oxidoreductase n=1 Tax=Haliangium sp. TaxID=2663208 RepID=UPI003D107B2F